MVLSFSRGSGPGALRSIRPSGPASLKPQHPVPNYLQTDIADPRGITATATIADRRQCQQATRLPSRPAFAVPVAAVQGPVKSDRSATAAAMASIRLFAMVNHISPASGKTYESEIAGVGIKPARAWTS